MRKASTQGDQKRKTLRRALGLAIQSAEMGLRELREQIGLSQSDVAKLVGVGVSTVSKWEAGHDRPTQAHRRKLARLYRVDVEQLGLG